MVFDLNHDISFNDILICETHAAANCAKTIIYSNALIVNTLVASTKSGGKYSEKWDFTL